MPLTAAAAAAGASVGAARARVPVLVLLVTLPPRRGGQARPGRRQRQRDRHALPPIGPAKARTWFNGVGSSRSWRARCRGGWRSNGPSRGCDLNQSIERPPTARPQGPVWSVCGSSVGAGERGAAVLVVCDRAVHAAFKCALARSGSVAAHRQERRRRVGCRGREAGAMHGDGCIHPRTRLLLAMRVLVLMIDRLDRLTNWQYL